MPLLSLVLLFACAPTPGTPSPIPVPPNAPALTLEPIWSLPEVFGLGLVSELTVSTDIPTTLQVRFEGPGYPPRIESPLQTDHAVIVTGLRADTQYLVHLTFQSEDGRTITYSEPFTTRPLPPNIPRPHVLALDEAAREPGYLLVQLTSPVSPAGWAIIYDEDMEVVWYWWRTDSFGDLRVTDEHKLLFLANNKARLTDFLGREELTFGTGEGPINHELYPMEDGRYLGLITTTVDVDSYPLSYERLHTDLRPATLVEQAVGWFSPEGELEHMIRLSDVLDTQRVGYRSLDLISGGYDWSHANGVIPTPDGGVIVSVRHQDVMVKFFEDGTLDWILGDPAGWRAPWSDHLLTPVGDPDWFYHAHAPWFQDGTLVFFDNHNHGITPYGGPSSEETTSRAMGYAIHEEARTAEVLWTLEDTTTGLLYSAAMGDADPLPATGNVLIDYAFLGGEGEQSNAALGFGQRSVRLLEINPQRPQQVIMDLRLSTDITKNIGGYKAYRVEHLSSLY